MALWGVGGPLFVGLGQGWEVELSFIFFVSACSDRAVSSNLIT